LHTCYAAGAVRPPASKFSEMYLPTEVETRTIDRHVNALRDAMDGDAEDAWPIQSVYGIGYKLEGAERVAESPDASA